MFNNINRNRRLWATEVQTQTHTKLGSLSTCITISQHWQGMSSTMLMPLISMRFFASKAETTGEDMEDALSRRMRSMCGRNGPPRTN